MHGIPSIEMEEIKYDQALEQNVFSENGADFFRFLPNVCSISKDC